MEDAETLLRDYFALARKGEAEPALAAAQKLVERAPDAATSHYALGEAFAALGRDEDAGKAFAQALRRAPGWADACHSGTGHSFGDRIPIDNIWEWVSCRRNPNIC